MDTDTTVRLDEPPFEQKAAELEEASALAREVCSAIVALDLAERQAHRPLTPQELCDQRGKALARRVERLEAARERLHGRLVALAYRISTMRHSRAQGELGVLARLALVTRAGLRRPDDEEAVIFLASKLPQLRAALVADVQPVDDQRDTAEHLPAMTLPPEGDERSAVPPPEPAEHG